MGVTGSRDLQLCSTSALLFPENLPQIDLFHEASLFYPKSRKAEKQGYARIQDSRICFLPQQKDSGSAEYVLNWTETTGQVWNSNRTRAAPPQDSLLSRLNFLSWAKSPGSHCSLGSGWISNLQLFSPSRLLPRAVIFKLCSLGYQGASLVAQLVKNLPEMRETRFDPWAGKIPWRRERLSTPVFWPGEFHGQSMESQSQTWLSHFHFY